MINRLSPSFSIVLAILLLAACASHPPTRQGTAPVAITELSPASVSSTVFPRPLELEPQIAFWRNVYGVWSLSQVALHDDHYLNVVYEVVALPGGIYDSYTPMQQDLIRERRGYWQYRLRELENKVAGGISLDPDEQALVTRIVRSSGSTNAIPGVSERLRVQRGQRERFKRGLEISGRYDAAFKNIFLQAGLPEELAYLPHVESSFQTHARSSAGAVGVWQFTRGAARVFMNVNSAVDERLDPVASARGAARYLRFSYDKLGSWPLALTAYNHGIGGMQRARDAFGTDFIRIVYYYDSPQFGFASRNFYAEFLAAREMASQPGRFFPEGVHYDKPLNWDRVILRQDMPVSAVARYYGVDRWQLITMNTAWTAAAHADRVPLPAGTEVWLPRGTLNHVARQ